MSKEADLVNSYNGSVSIPFPSHGEAPKSNIPAVESTGLNRSVHREDLSCKGECRIEGTKLPYDRRGEERSRGTVLNPEFQRIRTKHTSLASTGCGYFRFAMIE